MPGHEYQSPSLLVHLQRHWALAKWHAVALIWVVFYHFEVVLVGSTPHAIIFLVDKLSVMGADVRGEIVPLNFTSYDLDSDIVKVFV